jgi:hypothetical protein
MSQDRNDYRSSHKRKVVEQLPEQDLESIVGGVCSNCAEVQSDAMAAKSQVLGQLLNKPRPSTPAEVTKLTDKFFGLTNLVDKARSDSSHGPGSGCPNCAPNRAELQTILKR